MQNVNKKTSASALSYIDRLGNVRVTPHRYGTVKFYEETLASLKVWLKGCKQCCEDNIEILENQNKIKDQILGQIAISNDGEEKLLRYEIHLDRKLERILSMLLKLQHIKGTAW